MNAAKDNLFTTVKRGYDPEEVNAYIEELESKCSYFQTRNHELEQKLDTARRLIRRFSGMENDLRQNIADSKRAAAAMLADTRERSETLLDKTRESCGGIISDLDMQIAGRMGTIDAMKAEVAAFKDQLFDMYSSHIELIESLAESAAGFNYEPDYTGVADAVEEFERGGEPDCEMPDFGEYPEGSVFDELREQEAREEAHGFDITETEQSHDSESEAVGFFMESDGADEADDVNGADDDGIEDSDGEAVGDWSFGEESAEDAYADAEEIEEIEEIEDIEEIEVPSANESADDDIGAEFEDAFAEDTSDIEETSEPDDFYGEQDDGEQNEDDGEQDDGEAGAPKAQDTRSDDEYFRFLNEFANGDADGQ